MPGGRVLLSWLSLLVLSVQAQTPSPMSWRILQLEGVDPEAMDDRLRAIDLLGGCRDTVGSAGAVVERADIQQKAGYAPLLTWPLDPPLPALRDCLQRRIESDLLPTLGDRTYTVQLELRYGEPPQSGLILAQNAVIGGQPAEQVALGLQITLSGEEGAAAAKIDAMLQSRKLDLAACSQQKKAGMPPGGQVSLRGVWDKQLASVRLLSYSSGMEQVGHCVEGVLQALPMLEAADSARKGLSFQVELRFPQ